MEALAFTGGVGEHEAGVRARTAERPALVGVAVDPARKDAGEGEITAAGAAVRTLVVPAREDLEIAHGTRAALGRRRAAEAPPG
ncbi:hypothetical protein ACQP04_28465 [Pseudonocardia halophobica]|uniref:hypothetical protein n=1 Tax=Pseudonocardia halophobica TaxID=29401 RepID=UPI003D91AD31